VPVRNYFRRHRPSNSKLRIIPTQAASAFGVIHFEHDVEYFRLVSQGLKSVGKTLRNEHHPPISRGEFRRMPLKISFRVRSDIDCNIKYSTACAANKFGLPIRLRLKMETAKGPSLLVERDVALGDPALQSVRLKLLHAEAAR